MEVMNLVFRSGGGLARTRSNNPEVMDKEKCRGRKYSLFTSSFATDSQERFDATSLGYNIAHVTWLTFRVLGFCKELRHMKHPRSKFTFSTRREIAMLTFLFERS